MTYDTTENPVGVDIYKIISCQNCKGEKTDLQEI